MKFKVTTYVGIILAMGLTIGCGGSGEARNATDGASADALAEYEAAVAAAEGGMEAELDAPEGGTKAAAQ